MPINSELEIVVEVTIDTKLSDSIDEVLLRRAAMCAAAERGFRVGEIGIRVTDDSTIHEINLKHLSHNYPTDVISFGYMSHAPAIQGEMVVSVDTAKTRAAELGWSAEHELCLYVVHGTLHITGMDDQNSADRSEMRNAEIEVMKKLGIDDIVRYGVDAASTSDDDLDANVTTERNT